MSLLWNVAFFKKDDKVPEKDSEMFPDSCEKLEGAPVGFAHKTFYFLNSEIL